jgi:hypothetical protein
MKHLLLGLVLIMALTPACKKDPRGCYQAFDPSGFNVSGLLVCDKSLEELQNKFPGYMWYNQLTEETYCWKCELPTGNTHYYRQAPVSILLKLKSIRGYTNMTRVDCNSFCFWRYYDKQKSKSTNFYSPIRASTEMLLGDTCNKLYDGRVIVTKETADSIYTREFERIDL